MKMALIKKLGNYEKITELAKDYIKINSGDFYFLPEDLTDCEKIAFKECLTKIECEYVYNFSNYKYGNKNKKKNKQKVRIR